MDITNSFKISRFYPLLSCDWWHNLSYRMYLRDWLFSNNTHPKALFTRSVKSFVRDCFFLSLMHAGNFLLYADNLLRSKFCLKKERNARRTKLFTLSKCFFLFKKSQQNTLLLDL